MGRTPTRNKHLPQGMRARWRGDVVYYYFDTGQRPRKEIPLGKDYTIAVKKWADLQERSTVGDLVTFKHVADRYQAEVMPKKAPATQEANLRELKNLLAVFNEVPMPIDDIDPVLVQRYLDKRRDAPIRANREKALLSHIFNFARSAGLTSKANPCAGIKGFTEEGRDIYVDDTIFKAVWESAEQPLRDAMDLAYLIGQRPADVLKLTRNDIKDGAISVKQNKTKAKLRIAIQGELSAVLDRINKRKVMSMNLVCNEEGQPMTKFMLRGAMDRARAKAAERHPKMAADIKAFQFRDLRAKAGTDTEISRGMAAAKDQLGHSSEAMTKRYVRHRLGKLVPPTK